MANMQSNMIEELAQREMSKMAQKLEEHVDQEIKKLEELKLGDIESIREEIQKKRKARMTQEARWRELGHGSYEELSDEKAFFDAGKKSTHFIVHFYREATERCKIVDHHLKILANKHVEARFCKLDAEKSPFLTKRLSIRVLPTILLLTNNCVVDRIVGFTELGNRDDFKTDMMEWRLAQKDVIEYDGDKYSPPDQAPLKQKHKTNIIRTRNIRRGNEWSDSSDDEEN